MIINADVSDVLTLNEALTQASQLAYTLSNSQVKVAFNYSGEKWLCGYQEGQTEHSGYWAINNGVEYRPKPWMTSNSKDWGRWVSVSIDSSHIN